MQRLFHHAVDHIQLAQSPDDREHGPQRERKAPQKLQRGVRLAVVGRRRVHRLREHRIDLLEDKRKQEERQRVEEVPHQPRATVFARDGRQDHHHVGEHRRVDPLRAQIREHRQRIHHDRRRVRPHHVAQDGVRTPALGQEDWRLGVQRQQLVGKRHPADVDHEHAELLPAPMRLELP